MPFTVEGSNDSPTWYLGNFSLSSNNTFLPRIATNVDNVLPDGPPPTTTRSYCCRLLDSPIT
jgi:hypothetical protein